MDEYRAVEQRLSAENEIRDLLFEGKEGSGVVELMSLTGKREISEKVKLTDGANRVEIQLPGNMLPGIYVVTVNGQKAGNLIKK
jgi:hypothetical protein